MVTIFVISFFWIGVYLWIKSRENNRQSSSLQSSSGSAVTQKTDVTKSAELFVQNLQYTFGETDGAIVFAFLYDVLIKSRPEVAGKFSEIICEANSHFSLDKKAGETYVVEIIIAMEDMYNDGKLTSVQMLEFDKLRPLIINVVKKVRMRMDNKSA